MQNGHEEFEELIQEFIDGNLDDFDRKAVFAYLDKNPHIRSEVQEQLKLNLTLKFVGSDILDEPVPEKMKEVLDHARKEARSAQRDGSKNSSRRPSSDSD